MNRTVRVVSLLPYTRRWSYRWASCLRWLGIPEVSGSPLELQHCGCCFLTFPSLFSRFQSQC